MAGVGCTGGITRVTCAANRSRNCRLTISSCRRRASARKYSMRFLRSASHTRSRIMSKRNHKKKSAAITSAPISPAASGFRVGCGAGCSTRSTVVESVFNCITRGTDGKILFFATQFYRRPSKGWFAVAQFKVENVCYVSIAFIKASNQCLGYQLKSHHTS